MKTEQLRCGIAVDGRSGPVRVELDAIDPTPRHRVAFRAAAYDDEKIPLALPKLPDAMLEEAPDPHGWPLPETMGEDEFRSRARAAEYFLQSGAAFLDAKIAQGWEQLSRCKKCGNSHKLHRNGHCEVTSTSNLPLLVLMCLFSKLSSVRKSTHFPPKTAWQLVSNRES